MPRSLVPVVVLNPHLENVNVKLSSNKVCQTNNLHGGKSTLSMFLIVVGTTVAAILGLALTRKKMLAYAVNYLLLQVKYNAVAVKGMVEDRLQTRYNKTELPKIPEKVAIVTGGSRGMGAEIVKMLLKCDMQVVIACRRTEAGEKLVKSMRESGIKTGKTRVMELDNSSLASVKKFVDEFKNNYQKLDVLVNNAGIMFPPYRETKDGFEEQYGVNYLSHFLLTLLLVPLLKNAGTSDQFARVVNVSSCAHLLGDIRFKDINHKENFMSGEAYAQSKLAQLLSTKSLTKIFEEKRLPIAVNAVHPGLVNTDLFENSYLKYMNRVVGFLIFKNPVQGATPIVYAAVDPRIEGKSGLYISNCLDAAVNPLVNDEKLQDQLFELSMKQVGLQSIPT